MNAPRSAPPSPQGRSLPPHFNTRRSPYSNPAHKHSRHAAQLHSSAAASGGPSRRIAAAAAALAAGAAAFGAGGAALASSGSSAAAANAANNAAGAAADDDGDGDGVLPTDKLSCKRAARPPRTPVVLVSAGSFNPPTVAHVAMCDAAAAALAEVRVCVFVCV